MSRLPLAFFATAAVCALAGMVWGIQMGITDNFTMAPAHAHLNLVGWTSLALMGGFYALAGERAPRRLGWLNYALSASAVAVMIPGLTVLLATTNKANPGVIGGSLLALAGMAVFLTSVITVWRTATPAHA
jgi:hypothetical protein